MAAEVLKPESLRTRGKDLDSEPEVNRVHGKKAS